MTHIVRNALGEVIFEGDSEDCLSHIALLVQEEGYEDGDLYLEEVEGRICSDCNGSGEGMHDGTICHTCNGRGEL